MGFPPHLGRGRCLPRPHWAHQAPQVPREVNSRAGRQPIPDHLRKHLRLDKGSLVLIAKLQSGEDPALAIALAISWPGVLAICWLLGGVRWRYVGDHSGGALAIFFFRWRFFFS